MIKMLCEEFKNYCFQATRFKLSLLILAEISIRWLLAAILPLNPFCSRRHYSFALALFLFHIPVQRGYFIFWDLPSLYISVVVVFFSQM